MSHMIGNRDTNGFPETFMWGGGFLATRMKTKGIIYMHESIGFLTKPLERMRKDVRTMKEELRGNTVRLEGFEPIVFDIAQMAKDVGLDVWVRQDQTEQK